MVAGLLTLSLLYAWVDSQPSYQSKRQKKPVLAKALDWGVRIRIALAVYIPLMLILGEGLKIRFLMFPVMGEMSIGMLAIEAARTLTGVSLTARGEVDAAAHFVASYLATILTGLMHTAILAVLCGIIYGVLKLKHCVWRQHHNSS